MIPSGEHQIGVEKAGYLSYKRQILFSEGKTVSLIVDLDEKEVPRGGLSVEAVPESASVRLLNTDSAFSQGMKLEPGRYHVEISSDGYELRRIWAEITANEHKILNIFLKPEPKPVPEKVEKPAREKTPVATKPKTPEPEARVKPKPVLIKPYVPKPEVRPGPSPSKEKKDASPPAVVSLNVPEKKIEKPKINHAALLVTCNIEGAKVYMDGEQKWYGFIGNFI
ncbi:MAG: hypothetical protein DRI57_25780 [Deltaproteobacteria bacterium]|nr:MAG: hypothetical protein DRI57_25780 [Deltaproteobacteria bacterium]